MPINIQKDLPAREILEEENLFVMDEERAVHQDIRPLDILLLNLMPKKEDTELQILRLLSNSPLQVNVTFMKVASHQSKNTSVSHLNKFYVDFDEVREKYYDGMIITGAPVELIPYEKVDYWKELTEIFDWTEEHVTSTMFQCWGAQAALYYFYGLDKVILPKKVFGIFAHKVNHRKVPLVRNFDDIFYAPHSRNTEVPLEDIEKCGKVDIHACSKEAGFFLGSSDGGRKIFVQGHPEYDRLTLKQEYERDVKKGIDIAIPANYFEDNDPSKEPLLIWRSHSDGLYMNWLNYYVYQETPYER